MNIDWPEFSKLLVAFIGGIITTIIAFLFSNYRDKRKYSREEIRALRQIKVVGDIEMIGGPDPLPQALQIVVTAINTGFRPITIENAGLILEDDYGRKINNFGVSSEHAPWPSLPKTIGDGEAVKFYMDLGLAVRFINEFKERFNIETSSSNISSIFVKDVEGNEYVAKLPPEKKEMIDAVATGKIPSRINNQG